MLILNIKKILLINLVIGVTFYETIIIKRRKNAEKMGI